MPHTVYLIFAILRSKYLQKQFSLLAFDRETDDLVKIDEVSEIDEQGIRRNKSKGMWCANGL